MWYKIANHKGRLNNKLKNYVPQKDSMNKIKNKIIGRYIRRTGYCIEYRFIVKPIYLSLLSTYVCECTS